MRTPRTLHILTPEADSDWKPVQQNSLNSLISSTDNSSTTAHNDAIARAKQELSAQQHNLHGLQEHYMQVTDSLIHIAGEAHSEDAAQHQTNVNAALAHGRLIHGCVQTCTTEIGDLETLLATLIQNGPAAPATPNSAAQIPPNLAPQCAMTRCTPLPL